ncbi:host cell division inhibitor Icd-like protein [Escherichia coli]|uniref:Host cell division inhibitor Icd-like protein n=4 Tax=Escherichia coli TaxID=562 RepID=A0A9P2R4F3_ECOLX|nr:host cell division inhibitor Icd-like protein [Escherichia coli O103 str. RM8385]EEC7486228.1 host cell division inhibitor Icd-like protein [Escherichia coli]EER8196502.1 host cell division inhibitor Icd-like protein [Escherichia coli O157:H7]EFA8162613.1 host cell division inhibitor Icd-like protein [Escherichia coli O103]EFX5951445.1 host cell division inhibitor Icd-like protein [Shigella sonnei]EIA9630197.1 host cell division inhibitor Icd-like protein [Escherichia coli O157]EKJ1971570.
MNTGYSPEQGRGFVRPEKQNLQNFAEIIPVISGLTGGSETNIVNARALQMFDDKKGVNLTYTPDGNQNMSIISESGFYKLIKTKSAPLPERLCEQLTYCAKNESEQWDYINHVEKRHNCRITGKTKATRYGGPSTQATRYPQRMSIANNATFAAGGQCNQSGSVRCHTCNERFSLYSLRNCSRAKAHGANLSDSCSIFLRRLFRAGDNVLVNSLSVIVLSCIAMRRSYSHHGAGDGYSCSLALRRWRRLISPLTAVTINCALLSPSSKFFSKSATTSCGNLAFNCCDLLFVEPVAITESSLSWCDSVYTKKISEKDLKCDSLTDRLKTNGAMHQTTTPRSGGTHAGRLTTNDSESIEVAMRNHTIHPQGRDSHNLNKYIWRFIALSTAQPRVITIEATSEQEARQQSPAGCVMVFAARIRQGVGL